MFLYIYIHIYVYTYIHTYIYTYISGLIRSIYIERERTGEGGGKDEGRDGKR